MKSKTSSRREQEAQVTLQRLMRLQNKDSPFVFKDDATGLHFKVAQQHFPLDTLSHQHPLTTFWKLMSTHYFPSLTQQEKHRMECLKSIFGTESEKVPLPQCLPQEDSVSGDFWGDMGQVVSAQHLKRISERSKKSTEERLWMKKILLKCNGQGQPPQPVNKNKRIHKQRRPNAQNKAKTKPQLKAEQKGIDIQIRSLSSRASQHQTGINNRADTQLQRLEAELRQVSGQNSELLGKIQKSMDEMDIETGDIESIQWLIHSLEQKQIAESVSKVKDCIRYGSQTKFEIHFETAMNVAPMSVSEGEVKRINTQREISLLKFYRTGVKSLFSYATSNFAGMVDLDNNRMGLSRLKDKDYLMAMKRSAQLGPEHKHDMKQFDMCHHCKFLYPEYLLTSCRFTSHRLAMPKSNEGQAEFNSLEENSNGGRISHRFVGKHRNCFTGYARINDEYVCGRKFCKGCLKDHYGGEWFRLNNGICPFCEAACHCTRCLRNEKINKLKTFFLKLGGNLGKLQENCLISKLPIRKEQVAQKMRPRQQRGSQYREMELGEMPHKSKRIRKERRRTGSRIGLFAEQEVEKTSAMTADKELGGPLGRRRSRRLVC